MGLVQILLMPNCLSTDLAVKVAVSFSRRPGWSCRLRLLPFTVPPNSIAGSAICRYPAEAGSDLGNRLWQGPSRERTLLTCNTDDLKTDTSIEWASLSRWTHGIEQPLHQDDRRGERKSSAGAALTIVSRRGRCFDPYWSTPHAARGVGSCAG